MVVPLIDAAHVRLAALLLCAAFAASLMPAAGARAATTSAALNPVASVSFAQRVHVRSLVGFLHGLRSTDPSDRFVLPLHPTLWRGSLFSADYDRASELGARYMLVVSDLWGYPGAGWYGRRAPWEDWAAWSAFVRRLAAENRSRDLIWDIWNEPDVPYFWTGGEAQYHELYRRAYVAIREELGPEALIAGPSISNFDLDWLTRLLEFCRYADCGVDALSWHELPGGQQVVAIGEHVRQARVAFLHSPGYAQLGLREIDVSEYVGQGDALYGAEALGYVAQLERAGAARAAHACWPEPSGGDACQETTLDGLIDRATGRPRAAWWALLWYARGTASRVRSRSADPALAVLAARAVTPRRAEVVLGYLDTHDRALPAHTDVQLTLTGVNRLRFARGGVRPRITAYRVRSRGERPSAPTRMHAPAVRRTGKGGLKVSLRAVGLHDTILLRLSASSRGRG